MTPEEQLNDFLEYFNYDVPDPDHYPKIFNYYMKLYMYYKGTTK